MADLIYIDGFTVYTNETAGGLKYIDGFTVYEGPAIATDLSIEVNDSVSVAEDVSTEVEADLNAVENFDWSGDLDADPGGNWDSYSSDSGATEIVCDGDAAKPEAVTFKSQTGYFQTPCETINQWAIIELKLKASDQGSIGVTFRGSQADPNGATGYNSNFRYSGTTWEWTRESHLTSDFVSTVGTRDNVDTPTNGHFYGFSVTGTGSNTEFKFWDFADSNPAEAWDGVDGASSNWGNHTAIEEATPTDLRDSGKYIGIWFYTNNPPAIHEIDTWWGGDIPAAAATDINIEVNESVGVAEDVSISGLEVGDVEVSVYDTTEVAEDISLSYLSIVSIIDTLLVGEDVTISVVSDTIPLGLAHGNSAPYDYFSLDDSEADPITVQIELDQTGGDLDSDYVLIYLIADDSFDLVTIEIQSEDAGVEWKISETDSDYGDSINKSSVTAGAYPVYAKAIVANDGTITADQISANFKVTAW